jgi:predicted adenylyl cyclase CyaB
VETEAKFRVVDLKTFVDSVEALGAKFVKESRFHDVYYSSSGKIDSSHSFVRIRDVDGFHELTFKGAASGDGIESREEITVGFDNPEELGRILKNLGLKKIKENASVRKIWRLDDLQISLHQFTHPGSLQLVEVEGDEEKITWVLSRLNGIEIVKGDFFFSKFDKDSTP